MNFGKQFKEGLITQNPVLVQLLGMCSTMAITTSFFNGLGMGVSVLIILTLSNVFISMLRKIIPNEVRIACFIVVIAGFVTCVDLLLKAFVPALSSSLGVFIPLIVVNCIILGRAEAFASKNPVGASAVDGICQGIGYTLVLICMCVVRELLGSGKFGGGLLGGGGLGSAPGITIFPEEFGIKILTMPVGGFLTLGALIALMQWAMAKSNAKKEKEDMEHGKATERHGWLTANGTKHIISKTNQSRKEDAYGAGQTRTVYHPPDWRYNLQGQSCVQRKRRRDYGG